MEKMSWDGPKWGPRGFFPTNPDLADILGRTDFDFENFHFLCDPKFPDIQVPNFQKSGLGQAWAGPGLGRARLGPGWAGLGLWAGEPLGWAGGPPLRFMLRFGKATRPRLIFSSTS